RRGGRRGTCLAGIHPFIEITAHSLICQIPCREDAAPRVQICQTAVQMWDVCAWRSLCTSRSRQRREGKGCVMQEYIARLKIKKTALLVLLEEREWPDLLISFALWEAR